MIDKVQFPHTSAQPQSKKPCIKPLDKLLIDIAELARQTSLSVRTLRRIDAARDIPGKVVVGRRVLFQTEVICEWVRLGLPNKEKWEALHKCKNPHR